MVLRSHSPSITLLSPPRHIQRDAGWSCGLTSPFTTPIIQPPFTLGDPGLLVDLPFLPQPNFLHHHTLWETLAFTSASLPTMEYHLFNNTCHNRFFFLCKTRLLYPDLKSSGFPFYRNLFPKYQYNIRILRENDGVESESPILIRIVGVLSQVYDVLLTVAYA